MAHKVPVKPSGVDAVLHEQHVSKGASTGFAGFQTASRSAVPGDTTRQHGTFRQARCAFLFFSFL
jgi:hypothetical protein